VAFDDRALGMHRRITRRDFLNGVGVTLSGSIAYPWFNGAFGERGTGGGDQGAAFEPEKAADYYPPARTGLRGTHDGAWEVAHAVRDGKTWTDVADTGERYDLVVVGGGISGLAAAYFYRKSAGRNARILVLDNHDDFGGHAKRNEFSAGGRVLVGYGGTQAIEGRLNWSAAAKGLRDELGIDTDKFFKAFDPTPYTSRGLGQGVFFDKDTWTVDRLVKGGQGNPAEGPPPPDGWWRSFAASAPFSDAARRDFIRLHEQRTDYMPGLPVAEKRARLRKISYRDFLRDYAKVDPQVIDYFQQRTHSGWGAGIDAIPASGAASFLPGVEGMGLSPRPATTDPYIFHFPDGNASIARLLVRAMVPSAAGGTTMEDIVTAKFNYSKLDDGANPVRVRLNSTVVKARNVGDAASAKEVEITYVRGGRAHLVRAGACVLACYNAIIPRLVPELSARQKEGLLFGVKTPLVYTNVLLTNWRSFVKLGVSHIYSPSAYYALMFLDFPIALGGYRGAQSPDEPILLHHVRVPCRPGLPRREQHRAGRGELLQTTFETFERRTRDQLARMLGGGGFDPATDIAGITVNRWPHGYADFGDPLNDPEWKSDDDKPWVIGRQRFGRIAIANSDAGHEAETQTAIDEAHRAVQELLARA
jgi:spermidine dehydrogenase